VGRHRAQHGARAAGGAQDNARSGGPTAASAGDSCQSPPVLPIRDHLPTRTFPLINYALIAANIAAFVFEMNAFVSGQRPDDFEHMWGLVPAHLFANPVAAAPTILTSMFMHGSLGHIAGNMLFLWIFGDNVEDAMGGVRYLLFYLLGGVCAAFAQALADPSSTIPMVGASGAIAAVLAAYAVLYPRSPITVWVFFIFFLDFPAWFVIALFFLVNLWDAFTNMAQGGVAFMAHVGGFIGGLVLVRVFMAGRTRVDRYAQWQKWARRRYRDVF
jgi:membrane associated rhomboid family serine protease